MGAGGSSLGHALPQVKGVGRAELCPAQHQVLTLRGQAENPTWCVPCAGAEQMVTLD